MTRLVYSDAAERDLMQIATNIAVDNPGAALRFVAGIREHCLLLETVPFMGRGRSDLHSDIRSFPHRPYTIYYADGRSGEKSKSCEFGMVGGKRLQSRTCLSACNLGPVYMKIAH